MYTVKLIDSAMPLFGGDEDEFIIFAPLPSIDVFKAATLEEAMTYCEETLNAEHIDKNDGTIAFLSQRDPKEYGVWAGKKQVAYYPKYLVQMTPNGDSASDNEYYDVFTIWQDSVLEDIEKAKQRSNSV